ncbi:CehA/McbA family metallohydrolase [Chitinimonas arctica]|uniref:CehA/McbA family metallohydrolase n=1 Tax=Chitinimonas arctica TaxID=2594795 RepID=UPI0015D11D10|nr:CehA/McbA family metallohydrolase [Chitinimonas arctica]
MSIRKKPQHKLRWLALAASIALASAHAATPGSKDPDHFEFEATLTAPFNSAEAGGARRFTMQFSYPGARYLQTVAWQLELLAPNGAVIERWLDESSYRGKPLTVEVPWAGRAAGKALADGIYRVRMSSTIIDPLQAGAIAGDKSARVARILAQARGHDLIQQSWDIQLGRPAKPAMARFTALPTAATAGKARRAMRIAATPAGNALPYTVYYGNLHSQTNDSDGGGVVETCSSSQGAQTGQFGPADAYAYADEHGLDFLMTSEHNHYFDGSSGTKASTSAATARDRYRAGVNSAASYNINHSDFLAIYGMEWGVISNGGHLNILNSNELLGWEYNAAKELLADRFTAKSDYQALYAVMRQQGLLGQFNHPERSGQFVVGGKSLGFSADGDAVMALAEIANTSAFSNDTTESETHLSNYESAFNLILERGFHVAPTSNQDNHCANWGMSSTNRTAVLIPTGVAFNQASFLDAIRARRVFATMDKQSQLILSGNGHLMGERFNNSGPLQLTANFANSAGRGVSQVEIFEGVPGRDGTVSLLTNQASISFTPTAGEHFYYAKLTQDDGKLLWSAPIWINQAGGSDTTAPQVTATVTGSSGAIQLAANASDDVGVTGVDFLVDGELRGSDATLPFSISLDSTGLSDGSHTVLARAFDAAGNEGRSPSLVFNIANGGGSGAETEPNGTLAGANVLSANQTKVSASMGNSRDKDFFRLTLKPNETLRVDMTGPTGSDYELYLLNESGQQLLASEGSTATESLSYRSGAVSQVVYIKVSAYAGGGKAYTLSIAYSTPTARK